MMSVELAKSIIRAKDVRILHSPECRRHEEQKGGRLEVTRRHAGTAGGARARNREALGVMRVKATTIMALSPANRIGRVVAGLTGAISADARWIAAHNGQSASSRAGLGTVQCSRVPERQMLLFRNSWLEDLADVWTWASAKKVCARNAASAMRNSR